MMINWRLQISVLLVPSASPLGPTQSKSSLFGTEPLSYYLAQLSTQLQSTFGQWDASLLNWSRRDLCLMATASRIRFPRYLKLWAHQTIRYGRVSLCYPAIHRYNGPNMRGWTLKSCEIPGASARLSRHRPPLQIFSLWPLSENLGDSSLGAWVIQRASNALSSSKNWRFSHPDRGSNHRPAEQSWFQPPARTQSDPSEAGSYRPGSSSTYSMNA